MAHTFDELVGMQRTAAEAHARVEALRDQYGPPTREPWADTQLHTYETAWRAWRDLARDVQAEITEYANVNGKSRQEVEAAVNAVVRNLGAGEGEA
jgi:hypothetical protein